MIEITETGHMVVRFVGKKHWLPHAMSWVEINATITDGTPTPK